MLALRPLSRYLRQRLRAEPDVNEKQVRLPAIEGMTGARMEAA
jgi:hypothetical protein